MTARDLAEKLRALAELHEAIHIAADPTLREKHGVIPATIGDYHRLREEQDALIHAFRAFWRGKVRSNLDAFADQRECPRCDVDEECCRNCGEPEPEGGLVYEDGNPMCADCLKELQEAGVIRQCPRCESWGEGPADCGCDEEGC